MQALNYIRKDDHYIVHHANGKEIGQIHKGVDGYFVFWPLPVPGYWEAWAMLEIAQRINELNSEWHETLMRRVK